MGAGLRAGTPKTGRGAPTCARVAGILRTRGGCAALVASPAVGAHPSTSNDRFNGANMRPFPPTQIKEELDRFLSRDAAHLSREDGRVLRRARGFGLVGLFVIAAGGILPSLLTGRTPVIVACSLLMLQVGVGMHFMGARQGRLLRLLIHLVIGAILASIYVAAESLGQASPISTIFPQLMIVATSYILGVRAAIGWTVASVLVMSSLVLGADLPPSPPGAIPVTIASRYTTNMIALLGTCAIAVAGRRFADAQSTELDFLASHDPLTGLLNRRVFEDRLTQALARARRFDRRVALIFLDLDAFKVVNDTHGHGVGDVVLRSVAQRISTMTRETDCACRLGGDEFVLLVEDLSDTKAADLLADRVVQRLSRPIDAAGRRVVCGASVGVACYPGDGEDAESLLRAADHAMYDVKSLRARTPS